MWRSKCPLLLAEWTFCPHPLHVLTKGHPVSPRLSRHTWVWEGWKQRLSLSLAAPHLPKHQTYINTLWPNWQPCPKIVFVFLHISSCFVCIPNYFSVWDSYLIKCEQLLRRLLIGSAWKKFNTSTLPLLQNKKKSMFHSYCPHLIKCLFKEKQSNTKIYQTEDEGTSCSNVQHERLD